MTVAYAYRAQCLRIIDGDTIHADMDLGCDCHIRLTLRLLGINAPEMRTPEGVIAKGALTGLLGRPGELTVATHKDRKEKYGRYLAVLHVDDLDVNAEMVRLGHAEPYDGGRR